MRLGERWIDLERFVQLRVRERDRISRGDASVDSEEHLDIRYAHVSWSEQRILLDRRLVATEGAMKILLGPPVQVVSPLEIQLIDLAFLRASPTTLPVRPQPDLHHFGNISRHVAYVVERR